MARLALPHLGWPRRRWISVVDGGPPESPPVPDVAARAPRPSLVGVAAPPVRGVDPGGRPVAAAVEGGAWVLVFLTSSCLGCRDVWSALAAGAARELPRSRLALITPDATLEDRRTVASLAPPGAVVVMSTAAWTGWSAAASPWVAVSSDGVVVAEGPVDEWAGTVELARAGLPA